MRKIDDEFDAVKGQYTETPKNLVGEFALRVAGASIPFVSFVNSLRDSFTDEARQERWKALVEAANNKINSCSAKVGEIERRLESGAFTEAVRLAMAEAAQTTDKVKVRRLGLIIGSSLASEEINDAPVEAVEFIRAVSFLADRDIQVLGMLYEIYADVMKQYSNLHDPNPFTERKTQVLSAVTQAGIVHDDFYASCNRLTGFGLAIELPRNVSRMQFGEYCFRPTRRGEKLVWLLGDK